MSESKSLCPTCKDENLKAFADVPLEDPQTGEQCSEKIGTDCVEYEGSALPGLSLAPGDSLTKVLEKLAEDEGATPLTSVSTADSDHIDMSGDGKSGTPLSAALTIDAGLADAIMDQMLLDAGVKSKMETLINDTLGDPVAPVGCVMNATIFSRVFNNPTTYSASGTWFGVQDSDGTARYEISIWDQGTGFAQGYTSTGINQISNGEVKSFVQRYTAVKWRVRKYCGLDNSGNQIFSDWVQGPDITTF